MIKRVDSKICPECGDYPIHYSARGGVMKWFFSVFGYTYYRCWRCGTKFLGHNGIDGVLPAGRRRRHRKHRNAEQAE